MEASQGRTQRRPVVVDFLATLFYTFCIGVLTALILGACVVLMAGEVEGAPSAPHPDAAVPGPVQAPQQVQADGESCSGAHPIPTVEAMDEHLSELVLTHHLVTPHVLPSVAASREAHRRAGASSRFSPCLRRGAPATLVRAGGGRTRPRQRVA
jgi:hypothetical protein